MARDGIAEVTLDLPDPDATDRLGARLAERLVAGQTVLLNGEIGAGKSHLARATIRSCLAAWGGECEDIPSPTYTLVQTYETPRGQIWHADLYRLGDASEAVELGLDTAFGEALCLVEWPDRLGAAFPDDALRVELWPHGLGRRVRLSGDHPTWAADFVTLRREVAA